MSIFGEPFHYASGGAFPYDFQIEQSARFTRAESSYLSRTKQSGGNLRSWTLSVWVKFTGVAGFTNPQYYLYTAKDNGAGAYDTIIFHTDTGTNAGIIYNSCPPNYYVPNAFITDTSAWYHFVYVWDSDNGTQADRIRIYLNGTRLAKREGSEGSSRDSQLNDNTVHYIAARQDNNSSYYGDFYLAEMHWLDGYSYDASYFGESKDAPGGGSVWVPIDYKTNTGNYGTTGYYLKFENASDLGNDSSGNNNDWTANNMGTDHQVADSPTFDDAGS
mgnify:FL=1